MDLETVVRTAYAVSDIAFTAEKGTGPAGHRSSRRSAPAPRRRHGTRGEARRPGWTLHPNHVLVRTAAEDLKTLAADGTWAAEDRSGSGGRPNETEEVRG